MQSTKHQIGIQIVNKLKLFGRLNVFLKWHPVYKKMPHHGGTSYQVTQTN